jgi:hypothetical protein
MIGYRFLNPAEEEMTEALCSMKQPLPDLEKAFSTTCST